MTPITQDKIREILEEIFERGRLFQLGDKNYKKKPSIEEALSVLTKIIEEEKEK